MQESGSQNLLTLYSDVRATPVRWLWYPYIAVGKITLLQGDPGDGKSTMVLNLISEISKGGKTPDGKALGVPQRVIYQCSEDDTADTIKPRLESCGAGRVGKRRLAAFLRQVCADPSQNRACTSQCTRLAIFAPLQK